MESPLKEIDFRDRECSSDVANTSCTDVLKTIRVSLDFINYDQKEISYVLLTNSNCDPMP